MTTDLQFSAFKPSTAVGVAAFWNDVLLSHYKGAIIDIYLGDGATGWCRSKMSGIPCVFIRPDNPPLFGVFRRLDSKRFYVILPETVVKIDDNRTTLYEHPHFHTAKLPDHAVQATKSCKVPLANLRQIIITSEEKKQ